MTEENTEIKKSKIDPVFVAMIVLCVAIIGSIIWAASSGQSVNSDSATSTASTVSDNQTPNTIPSLNASTTASDSSDDTSSASSDDIYNYVSSMIYALDYLYQSTQEVTNAQTQYPSLSEEQQVMTASLSANTDLTDASGVLQPYINDQNQAISATAKIIYADILLVQQANKTVSRDLEDATPETYNPQQMSYDLAQLASAQSTLQKDLFQNQVLYVITKGLIEVPVNGTPTGSINFSLSSSQRADLVSQIQTTFGTALSDYDSNEYLLAVKVIQLTLSFNTYEEQRDYKLQ